jgi:hypothetical protein
MSKLEELNKTVEAICTLHKLNKPLTIPSVAKMLIEYDGDKEKTIKLFEDILLEVKQNPDKNNPFAFAAYKSTLETYLYKL